MPHILPTSLDLLHLAEWTGYVSVIAGALAGVHYVSQWIAERRVDAVLKGGR